jgi:hypothetical protein
MPSAGAVAVVVIALALAAVVVQLEGQRIVGQVPQLRIREVVLALHIPMEQPFTRLALAVQVLLLFVT